MSAICFDTRLFGDFGTAPSSPELVGKIRAQEVVLGAY